MGFDERKRYLVPLLVLSQITGLAPLVVLLYFAFVYQGGLSFEFGLLNTDNVALLFSLLYLNGTAMMLYRAFPGSKKLVVKIAHAVVQFAVMVTVITILSLSLEIGWENRKEHQILFSLHSWDGMATGTVFIVQWIVSVFIFFLPSCQFLRASYLPVHQFFGGLTLTMATVTLVSGVCNRSEEFEAAFSAEYLVLNLVGVLVLPFYLIVATVLLTESYKRPADPKSDYENID